MKDFQISATGDLVFEEVSTSSNRLLVNFYKSNAPTLLISFNAASYGKYQASDSSLKITFDVRNISNNKRAAIVSEAQYLAQQIQIRLNTAIGELGNRSEIGSKLETVMHEDIMDQKVQDAIKQIALDAIQDLGDSFSVTVTPKIIKESGYEQCIMLNVYVDNKILTNYKVG